ncbi:unnamed protein product [Scytosiphon promiscuus]
MALSRSFLAALLSAGCISGAQGLTSDTAQLTPAPSSGCSYVGDGMCDSFNNNAECSYDGGDCCECDCVDDFYTCGYSGYVCVDPDSTCQTPPTPAPTAGGCFFEADGWCDASNNNAECNYDGGDCCECDCVDDFWDCGSTNFDCIDPGSACQSPATTTPAPTPGSSFTGCLAESDGWCDSSNNNAECNYDGGDCCECDCVDATHTCGAVGFTCIDPDSSCLDHHYYDDDGDLTAVTDDGSGSGGTTVTDDDLNSGSTADDGEGGSGSGRGVVVPDDDDGTDIGGPVPVEDDDADVEEADDDGVVRSGTEDGGGDDEDEAPLGIIIGGAVGGAVFLGALVVLACCLKTGRLKGCRCCSSSTPSSAAVPPSAEGPATAAEKGVPVAAVSSVDVDAPPAPPAPRPPCPPPYQGSSSGSVPMGKKDLGPTAPLPPSPPPAYAGPASVEDPRP